MSRRIGLILLVVIAAAAIVVHNVLAVDTRGADLRHITIKSRFAHRDLRVTLVQPAGATEGRPLLVFLHGRGDKGEDSNVNDAFLKALAAQGDKAPAVVFPNGGNHGYWHDRRGAKWARYVLDEVIPRAIQELHADPKRVAIGGISMGGFGALDLARLPHTASARSARIRRRCGSPRARRRPARSMTPRTSRATTWSERRGETRPSSRARRSGSTRAAPTRSSPATARWTGR